MTGREATRVARFDLDTDGDSDSDGGGGGRVWLVGLAPVGTDRWHELVAAHAVKEDAPPDVAAAAEDAFQTDLAANTVVWEQDGDDETTRTMLDPGQVAAWPDVLTSDVWAALLDAVYRVSGPDGWEWAVHRLRRAPLLALEMAVAHEYRIPHSQLLRWAPDDRALAIAHLVEQRNTCPGCGVPRRAMRDPDAATVEADGCFWCGQLAQAQRGAGDEMHPRVQVKGGY